MRLRNIKSEWAMYLRRESNMTTQDEDIGLLRKLLLKAVTFLQEATLKQVNIELYYTLTRLHFRLYHRKSLYQEAVKNSIEFKKAKRRHRNMVMTLLYPHCRTNPPIAFGTNKVLPLALEEVFTKMLLMN